MIKKLLLTVAIILSMALKSVAQIKVGAQIGLTQSQIGIGYGADAKFRYAVNKNFQFGANLGYYQLGTGQFFIYNVILTNIPIYAIAEYYILTSKFKPFVGIGMGANLLNLSYSGLVNVSQPFFGLNPNVGFDCLITKNLDLRVSVGYNTLFGTNTTKNGYNGSYWNLNTGIIYTLGNKN